MSAQFGRCNFDGKPVDPQELDRVRPVLSPYGPDAEGIFRKDNVGIIFRAFHTTKESRLENQPYVSPSGAVITWDGRLDNRSELIHKLGSELSSDSTDLSIVTAAFEHWGTDSFAKLIGDWAISIWIPRSQFLVLAKDFMGTRHLYYSINKDELTWSTILDPLVLFAGKTFALCEEYIAGWLSSFPAPHLTPYVGIHSVSPSSFVLLRPGKYTIYKYWDFDPGKRIRYRTDGEYEEHFRSAFAEAVRRRLRSDNPILAELSGGMDSSSIVCVADTIIAGGSAETPRLDTVSYYNDSEPNWNERPYFTRVEQLRGQTGWHIDVSPERAFSFDSDSNHFAATPDSGDGRPSKSGKQFIACVTSQGNRVVLSGIGGDEVTGGVPTPIPQLGDLLARAHINTLARQLKVWALYKRKPWFHLLFDAVREFFPMWLVGSPKDKRPTWLNSEFVKRNCSALRGYEERLRLFGSLPSFQENIRTLNALRRQVAHSPLLTEPLLEKRYPYLDRGLLEFVYAIPREQLVRPGQRRSLMRRALVCIVPDQVLNRKRKAHVSRSLIAAIGVEWESVFEMNKHMICGALGIVDHTQFSEVLQSARRHQEVPIVTLIRTLAVECWVESITNQGIIHSLAGGKTVVRPLDHPKDVSESFAHKSSAS